MPITVVFFGTSSFAVPSLQALARDPRFQILAVVTQPDRPVGRHATITPPPVKTAALEHGLPVFQWERVKSQEALDQMRAWNADVGVVVSFGQILPQSLLDLFPHGVVNVHGSLLPKYRGASPISAAIAAGDTETGVTTMVVDAALDHGPLLGSAIEPIFPDDTAESLHDRLAERGASILPDQLAEYVAGTRIPIPQDHDAATHTTLLTREHGALDVTLPALTLARKIRAYSPWPGTFFTLTDKKRLKVLVAHVAKPSSTGTAGTHVIVDGLPAILCGDGQALVLDRVQPDGKPPMDGAAFLRGNAWI